MVIQLLHFILCISALGSDPSPFSFSMIPSKKDFYQGENITVSFIVEGKSESVDVEVAKFPEFRSFWSENTVLRQGPIPLIPGGTAYDPTFPSIPPLPFSELIKRYKDKTLNVPRKGIVGAYIITPMIGREDVKIEPMEISLKDYRNSGEGIYHLKSQMPDLTIRRLPTVPSELISNFNGAVGVFVLSLESNVVKYRVGEPFLIRFVLSGEGNFSEVNEIKFGLSSDFEILSNRSEMALTGRESAKVFEYTLSTKNKDVKELPPFNFTYFNPQKNRYYTTQTSKLFLEYSENIEKESVAQENFLFPGEDKLGYVSPFILSPLSIFLQFCIFCFLAFRLIKFKMTVLNRKKHQDLHYIRKHRLRQFQEGLKISEKSELAKGLSQFIEELLEDSLPKDVFLSRSQKLKKIESKFGLEARLKIENYLSEHDRSNFSKIKTELPNLEIHLQNLHPILEKLCS